MIELVGRRLNTKNSSFEGLVIEDKSTRILYPCGTSVVSEWDKAKELLRGEDIGTKCPSGYDTDRYLEVYRKDMSIDIDNLTLPVYDDHHHTDDELNELITFIESSDRWKEEYIPRIDEELTFFITTKNVKFLLLTKMLIDRLKSATVVGVGRGSSCASLVMYLLHIHDVNPVKYDIKFNELSKE